MSKNRYIEIKPVAYEPNVYRIVSVRNGSPLGWIRVYDAWKKWCFFPSPGTVWSEDCLALVLEELRRMTEDKP